MAQYQQQPQPYYQEQYSQYTPQHQQQQQQQHIAHNYQAPQQVHYNEKPQPQSQPHDHDHTQTHTHTHNHQQDYPLKKSSGKWSFSLFDCFSPLSTCCISFWCPCYLFGKTYQRNKTREENPSGFNGMCFAYCATLYCGCAPILQWMQRSNHRDKYAIDRSCLEDFCTACWCGCCALVQEEKESLVRNVGVDPVTGVKYQPVVGMSYP